jgi:DNA repair protein RadC
MAHSHPSGNPEPSFEDIRSTQQVCKLLAPLGIRLHDHIIIAGEEAASLSSRGLLPPEA